MHKLALLLACATCFVSTARAEEGVGWVPQELAWAEHAVGPTVRELELTRGRYRTMQVAGYLVAASAVAVTVATIPMWIQRHDHVAFYGQSGCGPNVYPYVAVPLFAGGLTSGIIGTLRSRAFTREHGPVAARRSAGRVALAGIGAGLAIALLMGTVTVANFCNS